MRVGFVSNFCAHYRVKTFELLAREFDVDYYFFSEGQERYWLRQHGVRSGAFRHAYLWGFRLARTRVTPTLPLKLWFGHYDVFVQPLVGRYALLVTYLIAKLKRRPFVLWAGVWKRLETPFHRVVFPLVRYLYRHSDAIVAYGEHVKRYLVSEGVSTEKIVVAPHAVDNEFYSAVVSESEKRACREQLRIGDGVKIVLYLGRLVEEKGLKYLLEAFATMKRTDSVLVLAGAGTGASELARLAGKLGVAEFVRFPGYLKPGETVCYYSVSCVCVLPSITTNTFKEPWGLTVNEAFNQGLPVIATDAVGAAAGGLLQDGLTGLVVPERNPQALTRALERLLDDETLWANMSVNARLAIANWTNERMIEGFRQAIEYVLSRG